MSEQSSALIPHDALRELTHSHWHVGDLLWRATLIYAAIFREWIVNVGSCDAHSRIAHLICELMLEPAPSPKRAELLHEWPGERWRIITEIITESFIAKVAGPNRHEPFENWAT
jgi:hypothetical protein